MKILDASNLNQIDLADRTLRTIHPGDSVRLTDCHAHSGKSGIYRGCERTAAGWAAKVEFEDGGGCYVRRNTEWVKVNA